MKSLICLLIYLCLISTVQALPVIQSVTVDPTNPWLGQDVTIKTVCTDANSTISGVKAHILEPFFVELGFTQSDSEYTLLLDSQSYLTTTGDYSLNIVCTNTEDQTDEMETSFTVSDLTSQLYQITSNPAYIGDEIEVDLFVYKDGVELKPPADQVTFEAYINSQPALKSGPILYDFNKGYRLKLNSPSNPGVYSLQVIAFYDGNSVTYETTIEIKKNIEFNFLDINTDLTQSGGALVLSVKATDKGSKIYMEKEYIKVAINSVNVDIKQIVESGDYYNIEVIAPYFAPGEYELAIIFTYNDFSITKYHDISYGVLISGEVLGADNKGEGFELFFKDKNGIQTKMSVDTNGHYGGFLPAGTYDLLLKHDKSTLTLHNISITSFDDPIKYVYRNNPTIKGMTAAGLFTYEIAVDYSSSELELEYNDKVIYDETEILVYQCDKWNAGRLECLSGWYEIDGDIDTVRNTVTIDNGDISTFVIGNKEKMKIDIGHDVLKFNSDDFVEITGIVTDSKNAPLTGAEVRLFVNGIEIETTTTEDTGIFSFSFTPQDDEGKFTYTLKASKDPYISADEDVIVEIAKKKSLSILLTDTVRVNLGDSVVTKATIINTGQATFDNIMVSLSGDISEDLYSMSDTVIPQLAPNEQQIIEITFSAPQDADLKTHSLKFNVESGDLKKEQILALTIINTTSLPDTPQNEPAKQEPIFPTFSIPTGMITLPTMGDTTYLIVFSLMAFTAAFILRRRKVNTGHREDIKHLFNDLKIEVNRSQNMTSLRNFERKKNGESN